MGANDEIKRMMIIAFSAGYSAGQEGIAEGFRGHARDEHNDHVAAEWLDQAKLDGTLERTIEQ